METITLGGGCFWCLEAVYDEMEGVVSRGVGLHGRARRRSGLSLGVHGEHGPHRGGAGDVRPGGDFDAGDPGGLLRDSRRDVDGPPGQRRRHAIPVGDFLSHAGADGDGAGADRRTGRRAEPIVTEVRPATKFYVAEEYHQDYFKNNPQQPYCSFVVSPKVRKFREKFAKKMRKRA